jgi:hypothetical protein
VVRVLGICVAVGLLAAACGPPGPKTYKVAKTRACLVDQHLRVGSPPSSDFIASTALGGSFDVRFADKNAATVSFGSDPTNGQSLDDAYRQVRAHNVGIDDVLRIQGNAVMLWHAHPSDADLSALQSCLK